MGENEPQRTLKAEKPLFVPHDGVVGVIVGLGVALGVLQTALFVLGEVAVMYLTHIRGESLLKDGILGFCHKLLVAFLKHGGIDTGCAVLMAVLVHLVNEEQGQHLNTLVQIPQFLIQVGFDGAPDLRFLDDILVHIANGLAQLDLLGIPELDMLKVGGTVDSGDGVAFIQFPLTGEQEQIVSRLDGHGLSGHGSGLSLYIQLHPSLKSFVVADGKQPHIGLVEATGNLIGGYGNLLD